MRNMLLSLGTACLMFGCGAPEDQGVAQPEEPGALSQALLQTAEGSADTEKNGNECCHWRCSDGTRWWNATPVWGQCVNFAQFWCASYRHGHYDDGSAYWGTCY